MNTWTRATLAAVMLLALVPTAASALRSIEVSETRLSFLWQSLEFSSPEIEGQVFCRAQMTFSFFSRSIGKSLGASMGTASASVLSPETCSNGTVRFLEEGTWLVSYEGIRGTLPSITAVRADVPVGFLITAGGGLVRCLYQGTFHVEILVNSGRVGDAIVNPSRPPLLARLAGSFFCPAFANVEGLSAAGTPASTVRLI